jgi:hypothetical protein
LSGHQNGCQATYILKLFVRPVYSFTESVSIYDNETPFIWHGNNYSTSGTYYATYQTVYGCDSIYQLNLDVEVSQSFWISKNVGSAVQANWLTIPNTNFYQIRYRQLPSGVWISLAQSTQTFRKIVDLIPGEEYEVQLRHRLGSVWQDWNAHYAPITFKANIIEFSPSYDIGTKFVIEWTELDNISSYILQYKKDSDINWTTKGYYQSNSAVMGSMQEGVTYQYRICPRWDEVSFWWTIPQTVVSHFIDINVVNKNTYELEFSWDHVVNPTASDYYLQIAGFKAINYT